MSFLVTVVVAVMLVVMMMRVYQLWRHAAHGYIQVIGLNKGGECLECVDELDRVELRLRAILNQRAHQVVAELHLVGRVAGEYHLSAVAEKLGGFAEFEEVGEHQLDHHRLDEEVLLELLARAQEARIEQPARDELARSTAAHFLLLLLLHILD